MVDSHNDEPQIRRKGSLISELDGIPHQNYNPFTVWQAVPRWSNMHQSPSGKRMRIVAQKMVRYRPQRTKSSAAWLRNISEVNVRIIRCNQLHFCMKLSCACSSGRIMLGAMKPMSLHSLRARCGVF